MPDLIADRYEQLGLLGGGLTMEVIKVKDLETGQVKALKWAKSGVSRDVATAVDREFYNLSRFNHPNIITVHDFGISSDGRHFFTMEYFDGLPFNRAFAQGYSVEMLPAMVQVLMALDAIHCQGMCHFDIKPNNILVRGPGVRGQGSGVQADPRSPTPSPQLAVKVLDFGFAEKGAISDAEASRGTLGYIAPEVFKGTGSDARADIYSLGMVLYEVLTGKGPAAAGDKGIMTWLREQYEGLLVRPRDMGVQVPDSFEDIVWQMMQPEPRKRQNSCLEVLHALSGLIPLPVLQPASSKTQGVLPASGFVGRDDHLDRLRQLLDDAAQGQGSAVLITGERGVGKSRLQNEFRFLAQLKGATIVSFRPTSIGARAQSLLEIVSGYLRDRKGEASAGQRAGGPSDEARDLESSSLGTVGPPGSGAGDAEKYRRFELAYEQLRALAGDEALGNCLLLLVDDFEILDAGSVEFLRYLVNSVGQARMMIVVCGLSEPRQLELVRELRPSGHVHHIPIATFGETETREMVGSVLGSMTNLDELAHWIYQGTGGNPLFVMETIHSLIDQRVLNLSASRWSVRIPDLKNYHVPGSIADIARGRLKRLDPEELGVLRAGAVSGRPLTIEFLKAVLKSEERPLYSAVGKLRAMGLIRPEVGESLDTFVLSSKMLESVVLESTEIKTRRNTHRKIALALEQLYLREEDKPVFDLAHHYAEAQDRDQAYPHNLKAGALALAYHLTHQALVFFETALALEPPSVSAHEQLILRRRVGSLREVVGNYAGAIDIYQQLIGSLLADPGLDPEGALMAGLLRRIGLVCQKQDKHRDALEYFAQADNTLKDGAAFDHACFLLDIAWSEAALRDYERAEQTLQRTEDAISAQRVAIRLPPVKPSPATAPSETGPTGPDPETCGPPLLKLQAQFTYYRAVLQSYRGNTQAALNLTLEAMRQQEQIGQLAGADPADIGQLRCLSNLANFAAVQYWTRGDIAQARELYEKYVPLQRKSGDVFYLLRSLIGVGLVRVADCDFELAQADFAESLRLAEAIGSHNDLPSILTNLGAVEEAIGRWDKAWNSYSEAQRVSLERGDDSVLGTNLVNLGSLALRRGQLDDADRFLADAQEIARRAGRSDLQQHASLEQVRLALARGRPAESKEILTGIFRREAQAQDTGLRPLLRVVAAEVHLRTGLPEKALTQIACLLAYDAKGGRQLEVLAAIIRGMALGQIEQDDEAFTVLGRALEQARSMHLAWETGLALLAQAEIRTRVDQSEIVLRIKPGLAQQQLKPEQIAAALRESDEAREIFRRLGARPDLERAQALHERITRIQVGSQPAFHSEYLRVFRELSEIISRGLEREDFLERVLDLVIEVTGAERGLLFLMRNQRLVPAAARGIDHKTLEDAETISRSLIRQVKRESEPVIATDALNDPRFTSAQSVKVNRIRSMLCAPLEVEERVIGAIYIDSRINAHLFWEEDRTLLMTVANMIAATIDRSQAFQKLQDEIHTFREEILSGATSMFIGRSEAMHEVYLLVERIAPTDCNVLLMGETGTGKGVLARLIHEKSKRREGKLLSVNCGALPETLLESELFGHAMGSFTDAVRDKVGLFEAATGGTLFLDEITNTTLGIQAKLLTAIEEHKIRRVGETASRATDIRLICSTNKDLKTEVRLGKFRDDLYFRLNVVEITMPPLRERRVDIPSLAGYLLRRYARGMGKSITGFDEKAMAALTGYDWPGNVRELQNVIERATIMCQRRRIGLTDLGLRLSPHPAETRALTSASMPDLQGRRTSVVLSRDDIIRALLDSEGNISYAAKKLRISRRQLQRLIPRFGINRANPE